MKRFCTIFLSILLITSLCCVSANADTFTSTRASDYIASAEASLHTGNVQGQLRVDFSIYTRKSMTTLGISQINVYSADGTYIKTIAGTTSSGLLTSSGQRFSNSYSFQATAGEQYYLKITFVARDSSGGDSKTYITNVAAAA